MSSLLTSVKSMRWEVATRNHPKLFYTSPVTNRTLVWFARGQLDRSAHLLDAIEFHHEALHVESLHAGRESRGGQLQW